MTTIDTPSPIPAKALVNRGALAAADGDLDGAETSFRAALAVDRAGSSCPTNLPVDVRHEAMF